jgi:hypothetical protein
MVAVHFPVLKSICRIRVFLAEMHLKGSFENCGAKWYENSTVRHNTLGNFLRIIYEIWVVKILHKTL